MSVLDSPSARSFSRWISRGHPEISKEFVGALEVLLPVLERYGFRWVEKAFDTDQMPANIVNLERYPESDIIDYVLLVFDKERQRRFQLLFGKKGKVPPHPWIRAGALVWKTGSELLKYKWWGPAWWEINKSAAFGNVVNHVAELLPQVDLFLVNGATGPNVFKSSIPKDRQDTRSESHPH